MSESFSKRNAVDRPLEDGQPNEVRPQDGHSNDASTSMFRSPLMMNREDTAVIVIDVQEKLFSAINNHQRIGRKILQLIKGAQILDVEIGLTEQYPRGLGATIEMLGTELSTHSGSQAGFTSSTKTMFSCRECASMFDSLSAKGIHNLLLCGIETHVCVAQTGLDMMARGFNVYVCVDAVGSRFEIDHQTALRRLENSGVTPTTAEAALFEWCETADHPTFKQVSQLIKES